MSFWRRYAPRRVLAAAWSLRPLSGIAIVAAIAGPWFVLAEIESKGEFFAEFFGDHNLGRFFQASDQHSGAIWYYVPITLVGLFPWSLFLPAVACMAWRRFRQSAPLNTGLVFLYCWAAVVFVFFSLARTKLPNYILPAFPPLAILIGAWLDVWLREGALDRWLRASIAVLFAIGLIVTVAPLLAGTITIRGQSVLELLRASDAVLTVMPFASAIGGVLLSGAVLTWRLAAGDQRRLALGAFAAVALLFTTLLLGVGAAHVDRFQAMPEAARLLAASLPGAEARLAEYRCHSPCLICYSGKQVGHFDNREAAVEFLQAGEPRYLVTRDSVLADLLPILPRTVRIVADWPDFPRRSRILVLGRVGLAGER